MLGRDTLRSRSLLALPILLAPAVVPGKAAAQGFAPGDVSRGVTVLTRPRPDYDPQGMRLGNFRLDAAAEAGPGWDSNVFGRQSNIIADGYMAQTAEAALNSTWTTHALGISGALGARQYFDRNDLNYTDVTVGGFGRYDLSGDANVEARYRYSRAHLDVYSVDVQAAGITQPVPYRTNDMQVGGQKQLNRVGLYASAVYRTLRYDNDTALGPVGNVSVNDYNTVIGTLGGNYEISPGRYATMVVRLQDISYTGATYSDRSSFTWEALAGFQYDFDGVWQGRIAVGWRHREYNGPTFRPLSGPAFEGSLLWVPSQITSVRFILATSIEESIRSNSVSYRPYIAGVTVDREIRRNVILSGQLRAQRITYEQPTQTATDLVATIGANWLINRNLALNGVYIYQQRLQASGGFVEFSRSQILVRLRVAL